MSCLRYLGRPHLAIIVAVISLALASPTPPASSTVSSYNCATGVQIIAARGTNQNGTGPAMGDLAELIEAAIPGSQTVALDYPASLEPSYKESEMEGVRNMTAYIQSFAEICPCTKQVIIGFSQGAQVIMDTFCGASAPSLNSSLVTLGPEYRTLVQSIVVYGDPSHHANTTYDHGTSIRNGTFQRANPACTDWADKISSWCDTDDLYCDSGDSLAVHTGYGKEYNTDALVFVLGNYVNSKSGKRRRH